MWLRRLFFIFACLFVSLPPASQAAAAGHADWDHGLTSYERFIVYPHIEKAFRASQEENLDEAIEHFEQAHKLAPEQTQIAIYLANAYEKKQNYDAAITLLKKQLSLDPESQDIKLELAQAQTKKAQTILQHAESLAGNSSTLREFLSKNQPVFTQAFDEYNWIKLLARASNNTNNLLIRYKPIFQQNLIFQIEETIKFHLAGDNQNALSQYISRISPTLALNSNALDQVSYQLMTQQSYTQAIALLLNAYPFVKTEADTREILLQRLALAQASTKDKSLLVKFVQRKKTAPKSAAEEKEWLELLAIASPEDSRGLLNYQSAFESNKPIQAHLVLEQFESNQKNISAKQLTKFLPSIDALTPAQVDRVSFNLDQEGLPKEALSLLLEEYPFKSASTQLRHVLFDRLSAITAKNKELLTPHDIAMLSTPLSTPAMRSKQSELLEALKHCTGVERVLEDYSIYYDADDWIRLGNCYQKQYKPGLAQFAYTWAYTKDNSIKTARTLAYQAFETKDFPTSLQMWEKVVGSPDFTAKDLKAATYTAVSIQNMTLASRWLRQYAAKGGKQDDEFWWLSTLTAPSASPDQAIKDIKRAIAIEPKVEYYEMLASLETKTGNERAAIESLHQALELNPDNSSVEASLGYAYYHQEKMHDAEKYLDRALKMRPDDNRLIEQLAYTNQHLGQNEKAIFFAERAIDNDDLYTAAEITPAIENQRFGLRRMHEDLQRRWTFSVDAISGNQIASVPNAPQPGLNYKSYGQAEIAYRLGDSAIDDGKTISVFSRIFAGNGTMNSALPLYAPVLAAGLRWKPFSNQVINLSVEEQIPLDQGQSPPANTLLRISASFFNSGKYSDEWHPAAQGWMAQNLYLDAAYYIANQLSSLTADYRMSYHNKLGENQTLEPYSHIQWNSLNQQTQPDVRMGMGVRWNIWGNESHYSAFASKISIGLEFQYAISTYLSDKTTALLTLGGRW